MNPELQQKLLSCIDEHSLSYTKAWQDLYTQLYALDKEEMQEALLARLQQSGLSIRSHTRDQSLFSSQLQVESPRSLLLYVHLPSIPLTALVSYITTILVSYQSALDTCLSVLHSLPINIQWLIDGRDAEFQHVSDAFFIEDSYLLNANGCIQYIPEQTVFRPGALPLLVLGAKGSLQVELTVRTASLPIDAQYGSIAPNAAWQLLWALDTVKNRREDILIEGFYDTLLPVEDEIITSLSHLTDVFPSFSQRLALLEEPLGLKELQQYYAYFLTPACTISYIHSGQLISSHEASIPETASAQLDFQLLPGQDPTNIYARLQGHLRDQTFSQSSATMQTRLLRAIPPMYSLLSDPFVQFVVQATTMAYNQPPLILPTLPAGTSSRTLQDLKLPTVMLPLSFTVTDPQDLAVGVYKERLIRHIKQQVMLMAAIS